MNDKYELTDEIITVGSHTLYRIRALKTFSDVRKGDLGGFVESEENLSSKGNCWVYDDGCVFGNGSVYDHGCVSGNGSVYGHGSVSGYGHVRDHGSVSGNGSVFDNGCICDHGWIYDNVFVSDHGRVTGNAFVSGNARITGSGSITSDADYVEIKGLGTAHRSTTFFRCKDGRIRVQCGCFYGTINQFRKQVKKTREGKIAEEYLTIADLMEKHFSK